MLKSSNLHQLRQTISWLRSLKLAATWISEICGQKKSLLSTSSRFPWSIYFRCQFDAFYSVIPINLAKHEVKICRIGQHLFGRYKLRSSRCTWRCSNHSYSSRKRWLFQDKPVPKSFEYSPFCGSLKPPVWRL